MTTRGSGGVWGCRGTAGSGVGRDLSLVAIYPRPRTAPPGGSAMPTRQSVDDVADPSTLFRLDRKIALVTGAGSGIGALAAKVLARAGAAVAATDLNPDRKRVG